MRIAVCMKQVPDPASVLAIDPGTQRVVQAEPDPAHAVNPADRSALELALQLVGLHGGAVTAVTLGSPEVEGVLVLAMARGASGAVHLVSEAEAEAPAKAALLVRALRDLSPDLILLGDRSQDRGDGEVWAWVAEGLGLPLIAGAVGLRWEEGLLVAERNLGRGNRQVVACPLPAVVSVEPGAAEPRYVSVHARARVRREAIHRLAVDPAPPRDGDPTAVRFLGVGTRRIRPKRSAGPDPRLSAADRLRTVLRGGVAERTGRLVDGPVPDAVEQIVAVLQDEGILGTARAGIEESVQGSAARRKRAGGEEGTLTPGP